MRLLWVFVMVWLAGASAQAQTLPQLYDVTGVAADDVLNIRDAPTASGAIIGALAPDARGIEVVTQNAAGTWGQVNAGQRAGWVSLRYMSARGVVIDAYNLPVGLSCSGTEPFWSLDAVGGMLRYRTPDMAPREFPVWIAQDSGIGSDLRRMVRFGGVGGSGVAFVYPVACNDGMSDRAFGLAISLMTGPSSPMRSGCCSLSR